MTGNVAAAHSGRCDERVEAGLVGAARGSRAKKLVANVPGLETTAPQGPRPGGPYRFEVTARLRSRADELASATRAPLRAGRVGCIFPGMTRLHGYPGAEERQGDSSGRQPVDVGRARAPRSLHQ